MAYNDWEVESSSDDRIVLRRSTAGGGALLGLVIIGAIVNFIVENWVYIVTILGITIICIVVCYFIWKRAENPGIKIFFIILLTIGSIIGVIYFGTNKKEKSPNHPRYSEKSDTVKVEKIVQNESALNPNGVLASSPSNEFQVTHKIVTNDSTSLRLRNAQGFNATQIGSLEYGSYVQVLSTGASATDSDGNRGNWTQVITPDGKTGWCFGAYLQPNGIGIAQIESGSQASYKVVTNDGTPLRLRNAQGFNATQIGSLEYGSYVHVLSTGAPAIDSDGNRGNWTQVITPDGKTGWCFGAYLENIKE
jgi:hypothetical protein